MATESAFAMQVIESGLTDGYWIPPVDVNGDGHPDNLALLLNRYGTPIPGAPVIPALALGG